MATKAYCIACGSEMKRLPMGWHCSKCGVVTSEFLEHPDDSGGSLVENGKKGGQIDGNAVRKHG